MSEPRPARSLTSPPSHILLSTWHKGTRDSWKVGREKKEEIESDGAEMPGLRRRTCNPEQIWATPGPVGGVSRAVVPWKLRGQGLRASTLPPCRMAPQEKLRPGTQGLASRPQEGVVPLAGRGLSPRDKPKKSGCQGGGSTRSGVKRRRKNLSTLAFSLPTSP